MKITEDKHDILIHLPPRAGNCTMSVILTGQGWHYSLIRKAWVRSNTDSGQRSLALVKEMLGIEE
jgi:hypothetical protein